MALLVGAQHHEEKNGDAGECEITLALGARKASLTILIRTT
jgi:hypothetical protein